MLGTALMLASSLRFDTYLTAVEYLLSILDKPPIYILTIIDEIPPWRNTRQVRQSDTDRVDTNVDNDVQEAPVDPSTPSGATENHSTQSTPPGATEHHSKPSTPSGTPEDHSKQASSSYQNMQASLEADVRKVTMDLQGARDLWHDAQRECERLQKSDRHSREEHQDILERYNELLATHDRCQQELDSERARFTTQIRESNRLLVSCKRVWTMARVRKSAAEREGQAHSDIEVLDAQRIKFHRKVKDGIVSPDKIFSLDHVFSSSSSNADVWKVIRTVVDVPLFSHDILMIMNGQSGTGKSHSMFNGDGAIAYAAAERFFSWSGRSDLKACPCRIVCTAVEVYNDTLRDLLGGSTPGVVDLTRSGSGFAAKGVVENEVDSIEALHDLFDRACRNRQVKQTPKNPVSSRGHLVCEITLIADGIEDQRQKRDRVCLVDLAGSEHSSEETTSDLQRETRFISTSRTNLQTALASIGKSYVSAEDKVGEVFLRDLEPALTVLQLSKVLKGYLDSKSLVLLLAHLSPLSIDDGFTLSTLEYADKVSGIRRTIGRGC